MKNLVVYKLETPISATNELLAEKTFRECGDYDRSTYGFHPTINGELVAPMLGGKTVLCFATQKKVPKGSEVKKRLAAAELVFEQDNGVSPNKEESLELKEQIIDELLPITFGEVKLATVLITDKYVYVEGNYKQAEVITETLRKVLGSLPIELIDTAEDVSRTLTRFVGEQINSKFVLLNKCQLVTAEERKIAVVKDLYNSEAVQLVEDGAVVKSVELEYDGIMSLVVKDDLSLSGIKVYPALTAEFDDNEVEAKLDKTLDEVVFMFNELLEELGGVVHE